MLAAAMAVWTPVWVQQIQKHYHVLQLFLKIQKAQTILKVKLKLYLVKV